MTQPRTHVVLVVTIRPGHPAAEPTATKTPTASLLTLLLAADAPSPTISDDHAVLLLDSVEQAVAVARRVLHEQRATQAPPVRIGLNAGDLVDPDGEGGPVAAALSLARRAGPGQILAAQVVWLLSRPHERSRWTPVPTRSGETTNVYRVPSLDNPELGMGVIIAEDSVLLRSGIARLLTEHGIRVLAEVGDADHLADLVETLRPHVVIADIRMPPTHTVEGIHAASAIRRIAPHVGILLMSQHLESRAAVDLLTEHRTGIGYLLKDRIADVDQFIAAVRDIAAGGTAIDPEVVTALTRRPREGNPLDRLSPRETEVLHLLAAGQSNTAIGDQLDLSPRTVESHVATIFTKLDLDPTTPGHRRVLATLTYLRGATTPNP